MKKIMAILCAAALAMSLCSVAFADKNIALEANGAVVSASSTNPEQPESNANDSDLETYWSSADDKNAVENITLTWDSEQSINKIVMIWGGGKPAVDGNAGTWAGYTSIEYTVDGTTWTPININVARVSNPDNEFGLPYTDTITWTGGAITAKAVRANFGAYANTGAYQLYEFEVYGTAAGGADDDDDDQGGADTGVASTVAFAVVAMSAAGVAFASKKKA